MKLKFLLFTLLNFTIGSYADDNKTKVQWLTPSENICNANGGEVDSEGCLVNWDNANKVCSASGGRLPSIDELKTAITECGGVIDDYGNNISNSSYQSCYKEKGFSSNIYWSSSGNDDPNVAWIIFFLSGDMNKSLKKSNGFVQCVKD